MTIYSYQFGSLNLDPGEFAAVSPINDGFPNELWVVRDISYFNTGIVPDITWVTLWWGYNYPDEDTLQPFWQFFDDDLGIHSTFHQEGRWVQDQLSQAQLFAQNHSSLTPAQLTISGYRLTS